jgi:hypothetical protein
MSLLLGIFRTSRDVRPESGTRTKADVRQPPLNLWVHAPDVHDGSSREHNCVERVEARPRIDGDNDDGRR